MNVSGTDLKALPPYALLKVSGPDAKKFLQGQLTCDLEEITDQESRLGAHCNPQGRVIFLFRLFHYQDAYYFFLPKNMLSIALAALKKYAVFFKVQLEETPTHLTTATEHLWNYLDIPAGLPVIYPETSGKLLPHELNLHLVNGISFQKGCYTGQEIIARMQHRGSLKNHMYRAKITSQQAPEPGQSIYYEEQNETTLGGIIVAACEAGYNSYEVLLVAGEKQVQTKRMFLETASQPFTFLDLPYSFN